VRDTGKLLVAVGLLLALAGAIVWAAPQVPWLGRLPGDIRIERPGLRVYFPIATCLLASLLLSGLLWILRR
jgi:hypothetical protein